MYVTAIFPAKSDALTPCLILCLFVSVLQLIHTNLFTNNSHGYLLCFSRRLWKGTKHISTKSLGEFTSPLPLCHIPVKTGLSRLPLTLTIPAYVHLVCNLANYTGTRCHFIY